MKYKLKMNKYDFYKVSAEIKAQNITTQDDFIIFETNEETKEKLQKSKYEVEVLTTSKKRTKSAAKKSIKYVVAALLFAGVIYINSFRVSKITFSKESPINEEIEEKINSRLKHLFFFDFIDLNYETFAKELREEYPMYPWINVSKKSSSINVYIYEYDDTYQNVGTETAGNIVAKKDAVIDTFNIFKGSSNIHMNQYVKAGEVLVSGFLNENSSSAVAAKAKIMGYTYETVSIEVLKKTNQTVLSGNKETFYRLGLFGLEYNFNYKGKYSTVDRESDEVFNLFSFLSIKKIEDYEKYDIMRTYTKEEAIEYAKSSIESSFEENKTLEEEKILNLECIGFSEDDEKYYLQVLCRKYESIGEFIKIS